LSAFCRDAPAKHRPIRYGDYYTRRLDSNLPGWEGFAAGTALWTLRQTDHAHPHRVRRTVCRGFVELGFSDVDLSDPARPRDLRRSAMTTASAAAHDRATNPVDSTYAWVRLGSAFLLSTVAGVGMWSVVVALPSIQAEFSVDRADASLPYTVLMLGMMTGAVFMGRLADRFGVIVPVVIGAIGLSAGYVLSSLASNLWQFALAHALLIGMLGCSACFGPLLADTSLWFTRQRGMAVAIASAGNAFAGALWPPILQYFIESNGWRQTHIGVGVFCAATMLPLALVLRRRPPTHGAGARDATDGAATGLQVSPLVLQSLLMLAGFACCAAMSMPQVHIVAYCAGLGYSPARGAEMLSTMLGFGILSRLFYGWVADRMGGIAALLIASTLQALALLLYMPFDGLVSLYVISALFGLAQGGLIPTYAVVLRMYFPPHEVGMRLGLVLAATMAGMAIGGWMCGMLFDLTGSYQAAFAACVGWNLLHMAVAYWLFQRSQESRRAPLPI
jgi:MFS family permease